MLKESMANNIGLYILVVRGGSLRKSEGTSEGQRNGERALHMGNPNLWLCKAQGALEEPEKNGEEQRRTEKI